MITQNRPFDDQQHDFEKMWQFVRQDFADKGDYFIWLFSRLGDWKYGLWNEKKEQPAFFQEHAQLWFDEVDQLVGFVLSEDGEDTFFIFTRQGCESLYPEILEWTIQHWRPRYGGLKTEVHEHQSQALAQLERRGFHQLGEVATTRRYDLTARSDEPVRLPPGYRMVDMAANGDYSGKDLLFANAFDGLDVVSESASQRFAYSRQSPAYDPSFDLSVVTPAGQHAASCMGFNDPAYGVAEVEKICTHTQFRRQGLAEAVIGECFQRLKHAGIEKAYITGYSSEANALYEKLCPDRRTRWFHYELEA